MIYANFGDVFLYFLCKCMKIKTIEKQEKDTSSSIGIGFSGIENPIYILMCDFGTVFDIIKYKEI